MRAAAVSGALSGKRVLLLRADEQAGEATDVLASRGAIALNVPAIAIGPAPDLARVQQVARGVAAGAYGLVVLTSANAVRHFLDVFYTQNTAIFSAKIAVIGPRTESALAAYSLRADLVAHAFHGDAFARDLTAMLGGARARVLLPRARVARDVIPDALRAAGHDVDVVAVYETLPMSDAARTELVALLSRDEVDAIVFTSSSTVTHAADALGADAPKILARVVVASIGPETTKTAKKYGIRVDVTAPENASTIAGIADALAAHFTQPT